MFVVIFIKYIFYDNNFKKEMKNILYVVKMYVI